MPTIPPVIHDLTPAAARLRAGELIAVPTETVYGLAGNALDDLVVAKIYAAKNRPDFNPLIVHVPDLRAAMEYAAFSPAANKLAEKFWPGPLTMVLRQRAANKLSRLVTANLPTVAIRIPAHPKMQQLLSALPFPLAAPSANPSGMISPTLPEHVQRYFTADQVSAVLDGGPCAHGLESTIIDLSTDQPVLLRQGAVTSAELAAHLSGLREAVKGAAITAPGMLSRHYAPAIPLRLGCDNPRAGEALLAFGPSPPSGFATICNLSATGDLTEAAANLYRQMHILDRADLYVGIATMPIPAHGLGVAIIDRLSRAAKDSTA
jgi:L-threonylcarbamoyladenylate synthase